MRFRWLVLGLSVCSFCVAVAADSIRVGGEIYENVVVSMKEGNYVILMPEEGKTLEASSKRTDVKLLSTSKGPEREALRKKWEGARPTQRIAEKKAAAPAPVAEAPQPEAPKKPLTTLDIRAKRSAQELAEFETQLLLWEQMPEEYRAAVYEGVALAARSTASLNIQRARVLGEAREANNEAIAGYASELEEEQKKTQTALQKRQRAIDSEIDTANRRANFAEATSSEGMYAGLRDSSLSYANTMERHGFSAERSRASAAYYNQRYQQEAAETDAKIADIYDEHGQRVSAIAREGKQIARQYNAKALATKREIDALEEANSRARGNASMLKINTEDALARADRELARMDALESALGNGYVLTLPFRQVAQLETHGEAEAKQSFAIHGNTWRVMWAVSGDVQGTKAFKISVKDDNTGKAMGGSTDDVDAYRRFLLMEGEGLYTVEVSGLSNSQCGVWVDEVESAQ